MLPQWLRERCFYMAAVHRAEILEDFRAEVAAIASGERGMEESRKRLEGLLDARGYAPLPGQAGTIKDLRSMRRIHTSLRTNVTLLQGWGQKQRGLLPGALKAFPGWELVRFENRRHQRIWQERFVAAGGKLSAGGRMIAHKLSPVWRKLGTLFKDSIGTDYPPFAWGSGMGWRQVSAKEMQALGLMDGFTSPAVPHPLASPNESLEIKPEVTTPAIRQALSDRLQGLAEWRNDVLVFTDPNGSRIYPAAKLAQVVTAKLPDGLPNMQASAALAWADDALINVKLRPGTNVVDDFVRLALRTEPLAPARPVFRGEYYGRRSDLETRLANLMEGAAVEAVADSWTLLQGVAERFAASKGLPYELVLVCRDHGTLREIHPVIGKVIPKYARQAEVIALEGTRFRINPPFPRPPVRPPAPSTAFTGKAIS